MDALSPLLNSEIMSNFEEKTHVNSVQLVPGSHERLRDSKKLGSQMNNYSGCKICHGELAQNEAFGTSAREEVLALQIRHPY